jgi:hypothetical protein
MGTALTIAPLLAQVFLRDGFPNARGSSHANPERTGVRAKPLTASLQEFANDIVIHNYRWRQQPASGDQQYALLEHEPQEYPEIAVPSITIGSDFDALRKRCSIWSDWRESPSLL